LLRETCSTPFFKEPHQQCNATLHLLSEVDPMGWTGTGVT
jgi:hypothetical protein